MKLLLSIAIVASCAAPVGLTTTTLARDSGQQCVEYCQILKMPLESVVVMGNVVGCVCDARPATTPASPATPAPVSTSSEGAAAGGMAALIVDESRRSGPTSTAKH